MAFHEDPSPPLFQPDSPPPLGGGLHGLFGPSSILDIPFHARPDWTTFQTEPVPTRMFAASISSLTTDASGCIGAQGIIICSGPGGTSYVPTTSQSVIIVPPESSLAATVGGDNPNIGTPTSPWYSTEHPSYSPAQSSTNHPQSPETTMQTLSSTSPFNPISTTLSPSPSLIVSQSTFTTNTDTDTPSKPTTNLIDTSGKSGNFQSGQHGPIAVYIILGVFVVFGLVCAIVTNRRFVTCTQTAIRRRNETIEKLEEAKRAEMIEAAKSTQKVRQ